jgi:hypothetical protein
VTANDADDPSTGYHARILYNLERGQPYFSVEPTTGICEFKKNNTILHDSQEEKCLHKSFG